MIDLFVKIVSTNNIWIAFLAFALYYILKKEPFKVFTYFSQKRENEHVLAKDLLESGKLTKEANEFLREHLEHFAFRRYYGISADADMRNALIEFQKIHRRGLSWSQVRRAYPNIELKGTRIEAKLNRLDRWFRWYVTITCWAIGGYATSIIVFTVILSSQISRNQFFLLTAAALILLMVSVLFSRMNLPYHNTMKIIALLRRPA